MGSPVIAMILLVSPIAGAVTVQSNEARSPEVIGRYDWRDATVPVNGEGIESLAEYDHVMTDFMREVGAPGGALTVFYQGRKIYSKGFGYADLEAKRAFTPYTPSRISSLSKGLTTRAIKLLADEKALDLDAKALDILKKGRVIPLVAKGKKLDPRIRQITVRQLMDHRSGLIPGLSIAACMAKGVIKTMGFPVPLAQNDILGYVLGLPLEAEPGTAFSYSNYGYGLLGKIVEIASGMPYEEFVRTKVLAPHVDPTKWFVTTAQRKDKRTDEAEYYTSRSSPTWDAYRWDIMAGAGGWVAPVEGIAEFFSKVYPGPNWDYTLFGSYNGAVTVMKVHKNSLIFAASINYRRGNGPNDNDILFERLEKASENLKLP